MIIAIVTNKESRGLALDAKLLSDFLASLNHEIRIWQYDEPQNEEIDLAIFLEVIVRQLVRLSRYPPWLIVNPEFLPDSNLNVVRSSFSKVICKTHEAHRICRELFGDDLAVYTGFLAQDRYMPDIERGPGFLHVAGHSQVKGTFSVIDAWRWSHNGERLKAPLIVVCDFIKQEDVPEHVTVLDGISDEKLAYLQNVCKFHLQPSMTEGYGHTLREALSVNAVLLTTNAPPMNEIESAFLIHAQPSRTFNQSQFYDVSALDIYQRVQEMYLAWNSGISAPLGRIEFLHSNDEFKTNFSALLDDFKPRVSILWEKGTLNSLQIAFLGNFEAPESTENLIRDALTRGLGHEVETVQENHATIEQLKRAASLNDMFIWVRTPGWLEVRDEEMLKLLESLKTRGIPTLSIHLDKFWGIPDREALIGKIPFWKTASCWTADGGNQENFATRGVNHFWMKPAMSELHLHPGMIKDEYRCDVGFVGAKNYHCEYPFRQTLIEFLEKTYGNRFRLINGIRGHELNSVYASIKVIIGDCFASGTPYYYSDRMPETAGRYGLLLSPAIEGLEIPFPTFAPQNLEDLHGQINFLLREDGLRQNFVKSCVYHVRKHDTWTIRMTEILKTVMG